MKIGLCSPSIVAAAGALQLRLLPDRRRARTGSARSSRSTALTETHAPAAMRPAAVEYVEQCCSSTATDQFARICSSPVVAMARRSGASSTSVVSGDSVFNNTVTGTGAGTNSHCGLGARHDRRRGGLKHHRQRKTSAHVNTEYRLQQRFGTNTTFDKNAFLNVTTLREPEAPRKAGKSGVDTDGFRWHLVSSHLLPAT